jgi:hypothetical protein
VSNTYLIVRESNKENDFYHTHVIAILTKTNLPKSWFRKGIHIKVQELSSISKKAMPINRCIPIRFSEEDLQDAGDDPLQVSLIELELLEQKVRDSKIKCRKDIKRLPHVQRILEYMSKDIEVLDQYVNYIYVKSNKQITLFN